MAATAGAAVKWLGNLAVEEAKFLYAVKQKVEDLQDELKWMTCFLQDVDVKRDRDARLREWIKQIVWMAYEAEDVIESFILKVEENRRSGLMNKLKRYACFIRELILIHKVGSDIDALTLKISKLTSRLQTYGIKLTTEYDNSSVRRDVLLRKSYAHDENNIVGMERDAKVVRDQLLKENVDGTGSKVVAIWGMGGLGKTTLAKKIYHQRDVREHFDEFAWAYISQQCQIQSVLREVVRGLTSEKAVDKWTPEELMERVHRVQRDKKCLIVLDDIWTGDTWEKLKPAFPDDIERGGKLILTTRSQSIAHQVDLKASVHKLDFMDETEARQLLERKLGRDPSNMFGEEHVEEMKKLVDEMLKHCGGLPLAIVVLGGVLATKKSLDQWKTTRANISSLLSNVKDRCKEVLELSYSDLPMYLKPCFLYLGIFPEDAEIPVRKLIHLWVAEGFISTSFGEDHMEQQGSLEEVAETYLGELVDRSLVQVVSTSKNGRMKRCHIHDLVRDICLAEAGKENFLKVEVADGSKQHSASSSLIGINTRTKCRRLAIHDKCGVNWPKILEDCASNSKFNAQHIKSLYIRDDDIQLDGPAQDSLTRKVVKPFKLLRVLELDRVLAKALPKEVGDFVHLRYLSIRDSAIFKLPSSIKNLRSLRTLDLGVTFAILPFVIWIKMRQLRHLYMPKAWEVEGLWKDKHTNIFDRSHMLPGKDSLSNTTLETIKNVRPPYTKYVAQCSNLRKLWFQTSLAMEKEQLEHMTNPQSHLCWCLERLRLNVEWEAATGLATAFHNFVNLNEMQLEISRKHTFDGNASLKSGMLHDSITTLRIADTHIENTDAMQILGRLPNLRELWLTSYAYIGKHMTCSQQDFPKLKFLRLWDLHYLEVWTIEEGAMSSLQKIEIMSCPKLEMIPDGIKYIHSLHALDLVYMPKSFTDRVCKKSETTREGDAEDDGLAKQVRGVDFHKVQHIPYVSIVDIPDIYEK